MGTWIDCLSVSPLLVCHLPFLSPFCGAHTAEWGGNAFGKRQTWVWLLGPCHLLAVQSHHFVPQFPHQKSRDYHHSNLILLWKLNEITWVKWLVQWVAHSPHAKTFRIKIVIIMMGNLGEKVWIKCEHIFWWNSNMFSLSLPGHRAWVACLTWLQSSYEWTEFFKWNSIYLWMYFRGDPSSVV